MSILRCPQCRNTKCEETFIKNVRYAKRRACLTCGKECLWSVPQNEEEANFLNKSWQEWALVDFLDLEADDEYWYDPVDEFVCYYSRAAEVARDEVVDSYYQGNKIGECYE